MLTVPRDGVLVDRNTNKVADLLDLAARHARRPEVPEDEVVVRAVRLEAVAVAHELGRESLCVGDDLPGVRLPG